ncbi:MAG: 8-oxo-dGTP diphosphatase [Candidatus Gracilibacteria bacterium]|nr:8-oxo-dGTP diphosphatase [Candidatus Gracilibacteria bacterium]
MIQATLGIMIKDDKIFLGEKKRGFGKGVYNGIGGKQEADETIDKCMIREANEEIGINIDEKDLEKVSLLHFYFDANPEWNMDVHIYLIKKFVGEIIETDEIKPQWFDIDKIPYDNMWEDDTYWLPRVLNGERNLEYNFYFDKENGKIRHHEYIS